MGYEVHITRKNEWFGDGPEIGLEEWLSYIANDSSMRHDGYAEATISDGAVLRTEAPGLAVWTAYSGHDLNGNMAWFSHSQGNITVKNPDEEILAKMVEIGEALGASIQGDEGETYPVTANEPVAIPDVRQSKPWWRFW